MPRRNGTVQDQRRDKCVTPQTTDVRGERWLRRCVQAKRRATVEQLNTKMNQGATNSVSQTTVQLTLLRLSLRKRRLVQASILTAVRWQQRLEYARQYSNWTYPDRRQDLRLGISELQETKLPVRLINTTNERKEVEGHEDTRQLHLG
ncbi:transposable element Tcb1 transposase [Trichonephila clavipes]|nr:transposable element Tcb1 transposase [Trichonephila clavipes]